MNVYRDNFLTFQRKEWSRLERGEAAGEEAEGAGDQVVVCDSVTHNVQLNVNC